MSTRDKITGKAQELTGRLTGDEDLEQEGKVRHAKGEASETIADTRAKASGAAEAAKEALNLGDDPDDADDADDADSTS